jgi:hypothetical protein
MPMLKAMASLSLYVMPYTTRLQSALQEWGLPSKSTGSQSSRQLAQEQKNVLGSWMRHLTEPPNLTLNSTVNPIARSPTEYAILFLVWCIVANIIYKSKCHNSFQY